MRRKFVLLLFLIFFNICVYAESKVSDTTQSDSAEYPFLFFDGTRADKTMNLVVTDYCSASRLYAHLIDTTFSSETWWNKVCDISCRILMPVFFVSFVHEEGHSSLLSSKEIASYVNIFPDFTNAGETYYSQASVQSLHDTDYSSYNRLCAAGLEADYLLVQNYNELAAFRIDKRQNMQIDALIHTLTLAGYEAESFVLRDSIKRGNDIGDLVHSLYHPDASVDDDYSWNTIGDDEKEYIKQIGMKSVINFINPFVFNVDPFDLSSKKDKSILLTFDMAYALAPFGDFINENAYFKFGKFNIKTYGREYCNKNCVFPGFGIKLVNYQVTNWCTASLTGHFWIEPENLSFTTSTGKAGGAFEAETDFTIKNIGLILGVLYKTAGYMPGIEQHDQCFKISCGLLLKC